jgi:predicted ATP-grasp superfamily ATP-dependent carboligase
LPEAVGEGSRVLVLDGQYCHALAAIRSLGQRGVRVEVAALASRAQGFASRYCAARHLCPDPNRQRPAYVSWLLDLLSREDFATVLCFEEGTADILSEHREAVQAHTSYPVPPRQAYLCATHKDTATRFARELGLLVPQTIEVSSPQDVEGLAPELTYPVVVKGVASSGSQQVAMAPTADALKTTFAHIAGLRRDPSLPLPVLQEYVPGTGHGLTALMQRGEPLATFMHRRLAEHDIRHGVHFAHGATGAESVDEPEMLAAGVQLLRELEWDGMAMVEFRRHASTGRFYFIEINPRFVGSLELAIAAGVDFPWLLTQYAMGLPVDPPAAQRVGVQYRWLISKNIAGAFERPLDYLMGAMTSLRADRYTDICWSDPKPHLQQLRGVAWWLREHLRGRDSSHCRGLEVEGGETA